MIDVRDVQNELLVSDLYRAVVDAEASLRHRSEYDIGSAEDRRLAILCWALHAGSTNCVGTYVSMSKVFEAIRQLHDASR